MVVYHVLKKIPEILVGYFSSVRIDRFHGDVIKLGSQNNEVLRILIYAGLKINKK